MAESGALGPTGYEQAIVKYKVAYADPAAKKFLPDDWALDNYAFNASNAKWKEKTGDRYRAERWLDEDGDGTISESEKTPENIFDLRFVNSRDGAAIWIKVHPLTVNASKRDLGVVLENYADGLAGTGLFEQSGLFGLTTDSARQYTTFVVHKEPILLGPLAAIRGVIEIAEVEKLRLDSTHRDSKAELVFAKVAYLAPIARATKDSVWPVVDISSGGVKHSAQRRTGLLVIGYYDDAARFDSHLADFRSLLSRIGIPVDAVPADNSQPLPHPQITRPDAPATTPSVTPPPAPTAVPSTPPAPSAAPVVPSEGAASAK